jgi:hypothetical protein
MKPQNITLTTLSSTNEEIKNLIKFLIETELATRKWIIRDVEDEETIKKK